MKHIYPSRSIAVPVVLATAILAIAACTALLWREIRRAFDDMIASDSLLKHSLRPLVKIG